MTNEDDRAGLIAHAIWDYWNVGSIKRLISVLRSESPLTSADRQLLADFIEAELKRSRERRDDSKSTLAYLTHPDQSLAKRAAAVDVEQVIKELRAKTEKTPGNEKAAIDQVIPLTPEKTPLEFDEHLQTLLRRLKNTLK
jgi:hypothetical protein